MSSVRSSWKVVVRRYRLWRSKDLKTDARGIPTHACPMCGFNMFRVVCVFDDYEIAMYETQGECVNCGTILTTPTLVDKPVESYQ